MMGLVVRSHCEDSPQLQRQITEIVTDAYWEQISRLCDDRGKMIAAMLGAYNAEYFLVAFDGNTAVGVAACCPPGARAAKINAEQMRRALGDELGHIACEIMKTEFETPRSFGPDSAYIEFVATAPSAQGKGVASAITKHIIENAPYSRLVLEVADTNAVAIKLYRKLGFAEFKRVTEPNREEIGLDYRIYMEYVRNE
jgi:ribosomal protein S18 acetylase RimI-like enzyme